MIWAAVGALEWVFWLTSVLALRISLPGLQRLASGSSALLLLNAAAVVGLYKFLFTRGPLWKIWSAPLNVGFARVLPQVEQEGA
jgi:hypothetical protein